MLHSIRLFKAPLMLGIFFIVALMGCQTVVHSPTTQLTQLMRDYIGHDIQYITQHISLKDQGILFEQPPIITPYKAIFSFKRELQTAIPAPIITRDDNGVLTPIQTSTMSQPYTRLETCHIIFNLQDQIAQSVILQGKAC